MSEPRDTTTYEKAGVSINAGDAVVERIRDTVRSTHKPFVLGDIGGFAGLVRLDLAKYKSPLLASATDGVGTKLVIAQRMDIHHTVGIDLVAMVTDDLVVSGAEPLFLLDYISCGKVEPDRIAALVAGIAEGCRLAGCSLVGGETAEHPGVLAPDEYDLSATGVGIVEEDAVLGVEKVRSGDIVIALGSSGLHSNGYSLARHVFLKEHNLDLSEPLDDLGSDQPLGMALLTPTRIYTQDCLAILTEADVHALAHVTGGGIPGNLVRILPDTLDAIVDRTTWEPPRIFSTLGERGNVARNELERTLNMGIGMLALVAPHDADRALAVLTARKIPAWVAGEVVPGNGTVRFIGDYR